MVIQLALEVRDGSGGVVREWSTVANRWASIAPLSGREAFYVNQVVPEVTHEVHLRYYPELTAQHRFLYNGRTLNIVSVQNVDERRREIMALCKEAG